MNARKRVSSAAMDKPSVDCESGEQFLCRCQHCGAVLTVIVARRLSTMAWDCAWCRQTTLFWPWLEKPRQAVALETEALLGVTFVRARPALAKHSL
jgi:hypothetical protein